MVNPYLLKFGFQPPVIHAKPNPKTGLFVVIPCYDEPDLIQSLESLLKCTPPSCPVEVITVINAGIETAISIKEKNSATLISATQWAAKNELDWITFHFIENQQLPKKHAGVGLARKIGMDEAVARLTFLEKDDVPIICFDADSSCDKNYFVEIEKAFNSNPKAKGAGIYFEHPISGTQFSDSIYSSIIDYELHLRYYKNALEFSGHPMACFTIGSSMAVMVSAYQSQGGMNKRKAGEDFYFMQKIVERFPVLEINTTKVIPSPRPSHRVPFGTGRAISEFGEGKNSDETYNFNGFGDLKVLNEKLEVFYHKKKVEQLVTSIDIPESIRSFLIEQKFEERIPDLLEYGRTWETFHKRFYNWFNAFRALKYVHFSRDNYYNNSSLINAVSNLAKALDLELEIQKNTSNQELLNVMRKHDKAQ